MIVNIVVIVKISSKLFALQGMCLCSHEDVLI